MKRARNLTRDPEIPVASFVDMAFLLNIFFIMVTSIASFNGVTADVPAAERSQGPQEKTPTITVQEGKILFNDQQVTMPELKDKLTELGLAQKTGEGKVVLIEAQGKVTYQDYFEIMADVGSAGGVIGIIEDSEGGQ